MGQKHYFQEACKPSEEAFKLGLLELVTKACKFIREQGMGVEHVWGREMRDFLALFLRKWGNQGHISSACSQTHVAWETQEL